MDARDTDEATEHAQIALLKSATVAQRFALVRSLSRTVIELSRRAVRRRVEDETEALLRSVALEYGDQLADGLRQHLAKRAS